ncbi:MAG: hypothetical protein LBN95_11330 [Prevotellaceae bacterium]|jgi:hypothetical protein|nr:hypothetical protein [Prevotellaceae bacterium]
MIICVFFTRWRGTRWRGLVARALNIVDTDCKSAPAKKEPVIPAQAGISLLHCTNEIPAFAGMTPIFLVTTKIYFNTTSKKSLTILNTICVNPLNLRYLRAYCVHIARVLRA